MPEKSGILELLDRPIAFHRCFAAVTGSVNAGLMLSQAVYWTRRTNDPDGWFYKSAKEWEDETYLTRREQETARKALNLTSFWSEKLKGRPATLHFRVDLSELEQSIRNLKFSQNVETASFHKSAKLDFTNCENKIPQIVKTINKETETTTETTIEGESHPDRVTISDALEDIYPGHATDIRLMNQLRNLVKRVSATPDHILAFPAWLSERYPAKANGPFAFKDLFPEFVKSAPSVNGNGNDPAKTAAADRCRNCGGAGQSVRRGLDRFKPGQLLEPCPVCNGSGKATTKGHNERHDRTGNHAAA